MAQNHVLGSGRLYFDRFLPDTQTKTGRRYLGNSPAFTIAAASTALDHFNADDGIRTKDDSVLISLDRTGTLTLDDISKENVAMFISGSEGIQTQAAVAAPLGLYSIDAVKKDRYYQIGETALNPAGLRELTTVVVKDDAGSPVTFTNITDYTVDLALGLLHVVPTGIITDGTNLRLTFAVLAKSREQVVTNALSTVTGALSFISRNPRGAQADYYMPYVQLSPNGDFALKGETWQEIPLRVDILQLNSETAHIYRNGRAYTP